MGICLKLDEILGCGEITAVTEGIDFAEVMGNDCRAVVVSVVDDGAVVVSVIVCRSKF